MIRFVTIYIGHDFDSNSKQRLSKRTVFKVLKNFIQNSTTDSLSSGSLESTVHASHILNQQILVEVKNLSKCLEALHLPSITQPVFFGRPLCVSDRR
jgi:hypothetical protein